MAEIMMTVAFKTTCKCKHLKDCSPTHWELTPFHNEDALNDPFRYHFSKNPPEKSFQRIRLGDNTLRNRLHAFFAQQIQPKAQPRKGRSLSWDNKSVRLYRAIFKHNPDEQNIDEFCREHKIPKSRYFRIREIKVSNPVDTFKLLELREKTLAKEKTE